MEIEHINQSGHQIFDLHIEILKKILIGTSFDKIQSSLENEILETNYLEIIKKCGHLSFNESGELLGAYPVSPYKTDYVVTVEGVGQGYSMCAIDAMGIPFLFMRKTTIQTPDKTTNEQIKIEIDPKSDHHKLYDFFVTYQETPEELQGSKSAAMVQCPTINFHSSKENISDNLIIWTYERTLEYSQMRFGRREMLARIQRAIDSIKT